MASFSGLYGPSGYTTSAGVSGISGVVVSGTVVKDSSIVCDEFEGELRWRCVRQSPGGDIRGRVREEARVLSEGDRDVDESMMAWHLSRMGRPNTLYTGNSVEYSCYAYN